MNFPERMPIWCSQDKIRRYWLYMLCVENVLYALFTFFGRSDGAAQVMLRHMMPAWVWPILLVGSTALLLVGHSVEGAMGGAVAWGALTAAVLVTISRGTGLSDGGWILPAGMAVQHVLVIYVVIRGLDADRERRQRRG